VLPGAQRKLGRHRTAFEAALQQQQQQEKKQTQTKPCLWKCYFGTSSVVAVGSLLGVHAACDDGSRNEISMRDVALRVFV